jgi:exodeoxyribonuclease V alpha subunit
MGLCSQHYVMLQRNLLYTGMTRAKERLVLVGDVRSVAMAVKNNRIEERLSRLRERVGADG